MPHAIPLNPFKAFKGGFLGCLLSKEINRFCDGYRHCEHPENH